MAIEPAIRTMSDECPTSLRLSQLSSQAACSKQQAKLAALETAAQEVNETHELLLLHKQRIPTVDTVLSALSSSATRVYDSLDLCTLLRQFTA